MDFETYQTQTSRTAAKGTIENQIVCCGLGLAGESGEVVDLIKKIIYHGKPLDKAKIMLEMGDVLWYLSNLANALEVSLSTVAQMNLTKLQMRYPNGFSVQASNNRKHNMICLVEDPECQGNCQWCLAVNNA